MIQNGLCDNFLFHSNFYVRTTPNATSKLPGGPDSPGPTARKSHSPCELRNNLRRKYTFEQHYPRARCWPRGNHREAFSRQRGPVAKAMLNQGPSVTCGSFIPKSSQLNLFKPSPENPKAPKDCFQKKLPSPKDGPRDSPLMSHVRVQSRALLRLWWGNCYHYTMAWQLTLT